MLPVARLHYHWRRQLNNFSPFYRNTKTNYYQIKPMFMKLVSYCFVAVVCLLTVSCSEKETPGGVKYKSFRTGDGKAPALGQFLILNMELKDSKDSIWFSSAQAGSPVIIPVPDASMEKDPGEYGVFKALTKGDSVFFELSAMSLFSKPETGQYRTELTLKACLNLMLACRKF